MYLDLVFQSTIIYYCQVNIGRNKIFFPLKDWQRVCKAEKEAAGPWVIQGSVAIMINRAIRQLLQTVADPLVPDMLNNQYADMLIYSVLLNLKDVSMLH